jgi:hypothetical protein
MARGTSKSTEIIQRLLEERRQYEAWLARLNSSADATPGNVRARVREDYEARLVAVMEELRAHAESARLAIQEKRHMRGELQKKEAIAAEKLTETELRHSVGEYEETQWEGWTVSAYSARRPGRGSAARRRKRSCVRAPR